MKINHSTSIAHELYTTIRIIDKYIILYCDTYMHTREHTCTQHKHNTYAYTMILDKY